MKSTRDTHRFSATTSRFLLPTFRRPCYLDIIKTNVPKSLNKSNIFHKWTEEGQAPYYTIINDALLSDNYNILNQNMIYINNLREAIKENLHQDSIKVYRNLKFCSTYVKDEYKEGMTFLWPTFSSTSRNKDVASTFGNYTFEINASTNDFTYRTDISMYSKYSYEQEVLFYPYSGFRVKKIIPDARIIQLECVDTIEVESNSRILVPEQVKIFDAERKMFVYFYKDNEDLHWSHADTPDQMYLIGQNMNGYWDSHYRYHHSNGYFVHKGNNLWEEYQNEQFHASFQQI